jgi:CspA family cold shock protein
MNFKDQWATDEDGKQFVFTVEMQRKLSEAGLPVEPTSLSQLPGTPAKKSDASSPAPKNKPKRQPEPKADSTFEEPETIQIDPQTGKYLGSVKWYNPSKGFGFIARGGGEEIFFHKSDILCASDDLYPGTWILYDVEETEKGLEANEIELYEKA